MGPRFVLENNMGAFKSWRLWFLSVSKFLVISFIYYISLSLSLCMMHSSQNEGQTGSYNWCSRFSPKRLLNLERLSKKSKHWQREKGRKKGRERVRALATMGTTCLTRWTTTQLVGMLQNSELVFVQHMSGGSDLSQLLCSPFTGSWSPPAFRYRSTAAELYTLNWKRQVMWPFKGHIKRWTLASTTLFESMSVHCYPCKDQKLGDSDELQIHMTASNDYHSYSGSHAFIRLLTENSKTINNVMTSCWGFIITVRMGFDQSETRIGTCRSVRTMSNNNLIISHIDTIMKTIIIIYLYRYSYSP